MSEGIPQTPPNTNERIKTPHEEFLVLAKELHDSGEVFPFPGLEQEAYAKLKAVDDEFPDLSTPTDVIIERLQSEGMKVSLGPNPQSGNVYILPAHSDDPRNDMIAPKYFQTNGTLPEKIRRLIELAKRY